MLHLLVVVLGLSSFSLASRPGDKDPAAQVFQVTALPRGAFHAKALPHKTINKELKAFSASDLHAAFHEHSQRLPQHMLDVLPSSFAATTQSLKQRASAQKESATAFAEQQAKAKTSSLDASVERKKKKNKDEDEESGGGSGPGRDGRREDVSLNKRDGRGDDGWSSEEELSRNPNPDSEDDKSSAGDGMNGGSNGDGWSSEEDQGSENPNPDDLAMQGELGGCRLGWPKKCKKGFVECGLATEEKKCGVFKKDFQKLCCAEPKETVVYPPNDPNLPAKHGQILRGTLDFNGYAFAVHMDRQAWKKVYQKKTLKKGFWQAQGSMSFKLLRYPTDEKAQATKGRKFKAGKVDFQDIISKGWIGHVQLVGWWDDETNHFRGKAIREGKIKSQNDWLSHAMLPWREIDIRFDDEGAHCRFDWYKEKGFFGKIGDAFTGKDMDYGIFRLDALPANEDPSKVFVGMVYEKEILSEMTIRTDKCVPGQGSGTFRCGLEQRPISTTRGLLYREPAHGNTGEGAWFTFMGTVGKLMLEFEPQGGNYVAKPINAVCAGMDPCPFIVQETFEVQMIDNQVLVRQKGEGAKEGGTWFFYPVFDDKTMDVQPDTNNLQGFDASQTSVIPEMPTNAALEDAPQKSGDTATQEASPKEVRQHMDEGSE